MSLLTAYYYTSSDTKIQYIYLLAEITLKLGLQSTEAYFPYILFMRFLFCFFIMKEGVFYANIEAS